MDIGSILLILGLFILVGLFVSRPLLEKRSESVSEAEHQLSALMAERDRLLDALQELDFDHTLGKIPTGDYPGQRERLVRRGAEVLRQLDVLQSGDGSGDVSVRLEAAIAARTADSTGGPEPVTRRRSPVVVDPDDELEARIADRRRKRSEKAAGFCPGCGLPFQQSDQFCARCGTKLIS